MIGQLNPQWRDVYIVGGGIAGLLIAYRCEQLGYHVTLCEASHRFGGLIGTQKTFWGLAESGPHSLLATGSVLKLCQELEIPLVPIKPTSRARWIYRNGKLHRFPLSLLETIECLRHLGKSPLQNLQHTTVGAWGRHFLGSTGTACLLTPWIRGIYGAHPDELSLQAVFPKFAASTDRSLAHTLIHFLAGALWERFQANLTFPLSLLPLSQRAYHHPPSKKIMAPLNGMGTLIDALEQHLRNRLGARLQLETAITSLPSHSTNIVLAVPAHTAGKLIRPLDPLLGTSLQTTSYTPLMSVTTWVSKKALKWIPEGIGLLMSEGESKECLGILFPSETFENRVNHPDWMTCTLFFGGTLCPMSLGWSDSMVRKKVFEQLQHVLGLQIPPLGEIIHRWPDAIPQYNECLQQSWKLAQNGWCQFPGHLLAGNFTGQISLRGMIENIDKILIPFSKTIK